MREGGPEFENGRYTLLGAVQGREGRLKAIQRLRDIVLKTKYAGPLAV